MYGILYLSAQAVPPEEPDYDQMWDALAQRGKSLTKEAQKEMLMGFNDVLDGTHTFVEIMAPLVKASRTGRPKGRQGFPLKTTKRDPCAFEEVEEALSKQGKREPKGKVVVKRALEEGPTQGGSVSLGFFTFQWFADN